MKPSPGVSYFTHTAEDGRAWQPLVTHLRNVAELAREFAGPLGLADEAELAGMIHDLGKYTDRFQQRLRNPAIHGIISSEGRYGPTYAHDDRAFEFGSWLRPEFKLYVVKGMPASWQREKPSPHLSRLVIFIPDILEPL